jgi:hypothetical protein
MISLGMIYWKENTAREKEADMRRNGCVLGLVLTLLWIGIASAQQPLTFAGQTRAGRIQRRSGGW